MSNNWSAPTSWDEVCRRKAGRDRYNSVRRLLRAERRFRVLELLARYGMDRGVQARIARELGVSRVTISRDVEALLFNHTPCPTCGSLVPADKFKTLGLKP